MQRTYILADYAMRAACGHDTQSSNHCVSLVYRDEGRPVVCVVSKNQASIWPLQLCLSCLGQKRSNTNLTGGRLSAVIIRNMFSPWPAVHVYPDLRFMCTVGGIVLLFMFCFCRNGGRGIPTDVHQHYGFRVRGALLRGQLSPRPVRGRTLRGRLFQGEH